MNTLTEEQHKQIRQKLPDWARYYAMCKQGSIYCFVYEPQRVFPMNFWSAKGKQSFIMDVDPTGIDWTKTVTMV